MKQTLEILHLEDDPVFSKIVDYTLQEHGIAVDQYDSISKVPLNSSVKYAAAIVDLFLVDTSGGQTISRFRDRWPYLPVLVVSASDLSLMKELCDAMGAFAYFSKSDWEDRKEVPQSILLSLKAAIEATRNEHLKVIDKALQQIREEARRLKESK